MSRTETDGPLSKNDRLAALAGWLDGDANQRWNKGDRVGAFTASCHARGVLMAMRYWPGAPDSAPEEIHADLVELFREALMAEHSHDWDMETVSAAAHICARALSLES